MANVVNIEERLLDIIKSGKSFAVALTGEWGIGKTHLWKNFRDKNRGLFSGKKYAYISLFGLDSLESLKLAIATEVQTDATDDSPLNVDISKHFKKLFGFVGGGSIGASGDMRFGINIGNKLITNIVNPQ
jgi:AAA+ ATPase superfamily predicted ATPase